MYFQAIICKMYFEKAMKNVTDGYSDIKSQIYGQTKVNIDTGSRGITLVLLINVRCQNHIIQLSPTKYLFPQVSSQIKINSTQSPLDIVNHKKNIIKTIQHRSYETEFSSISKC